MKKYLVTFLLAITLVPSVALASWWNPISWNIWNIFRSSSLGQQVQEINKDKKAPQKTQTKIATTTVSGNILYCNGLKYNKCPIGQSFVCPENEQEAFCEKDKTSEIKTPKTKDATVPLSVSKTEKLVQPVKAETKTENFNYLVIQVNKSITESVEQSLKLNIEFRTILQSRQQRSLDLQSEFQNHVVESVPKGVNIPNDMNRAIAKQYADDSEFARISIEIESTLIKALNDIIIQNRTFQNKASLSYYTEEQAIFSINKDTNEGYDALIYLNQKTRDNYDKYITFSKKTDSLVSQAVTALKKNADEYENQALLAKTAQPIQQISVPKIEFPKTTNCTLSGDGGAGLQAYVNCITY
ncbi:MAG: hypothetical protein NT098_01110 [Candidatus Parcubacteria bacterium]|nr:hypothetical protein [Candidatus Parcubacteria bacterium]